MTNQTSLAQNYPKKELIPKIEPICDLKAIQRIKKDAPIHGSLWAFYPKKTLDYLGIQKQEIQDFYALEL
ncbi:MAG: hypothetical protein GXP14_04565 [Gammaproteobacteria bacterium]|nr:hypothetical protein [Gammaproteobacteria bacterium]